MLLKFLADAFYDGQLIYSKDQIVEVPNNLGFADRWIRRGLALPVDYPAPIRTDEILEKANAQVEYREEKPRKPRGRPQGFKKVVPSDLGDIDL